jgi:hypothetical protein
MRIPTLVCDWLAARLMARVGHTAPDQYVRDSTGTLLIKRWNLSSTRWLSVRLHMICASDGDRYLHNHPWRNITVVLCGRYDEILPGGVVRTRKPGEIIARRATALHRIVLRHPDDRCVSLFLHGRKVREFGFWRPATEPE